MPEKRVRSVSQMAASWPEGFVPEERMSAEERPPLLPRGPGPLHPHRNRSAPVFWSAAEIDDLDHATFGLRRSRPERSAGEPTWAWQKAALALIALAIAAGAVASPRYATFALAAALALPFLCVVLLRAAALWYATGQRALAAASDRAPATPASSSGPVPRYSLLIPLYDEAAVIPDLVKALDGLDYPRDRLQVLLILEAEDTATRSAVAALSLPPQMSTVIVPPGEPRTKPRALNYALRQSTGDLVVVYDAEDAPEPDQLRRAAALLAADPHLACVQARLNVFNFEETWLTRQFAIEYTVLFDYLLPTLERLGLPLPLGGTSNHFSRQALEAIGGWDPYNVTEDADLGIRLAREGRPVTVLASTTWEEAPPTFLNWRNQRTRWLKGWMQTYLVHTREPVRMLRELGWFPFLGLQVLMGGLILSALVHPWFYVLAAAEIAWGSLLMVEQSMLSKVMTVIGVVNLVLSYAIGAALGCIAVVRRRRPELMLSVLAMPIYWLLISLAAYRALFQLVSTPYKWEKTMHRPRAIYTSPPDE